MSTRSTIIVICIVSALLLAAGAALSPFLPAQGATHWNAQGQADGYSSKGFVVLFMPLVGLGMSLFILLLPQIDPKKANIALFRRDYNLFVIFFLGFLGVVHLLSLAWNLGWEVNMTKAILPLFAGLNYFIGYLMGKARQNFFIGIRTPWTLSSETVWNKTHQQASIWYKISAGVSLVGLLMPEGIAFIFVIAPLILVSLYVVGYSFVEFQRKQKG